VIAPRNHSAIYWYIHEFIIKISAHPRNDSRK